MVAGGLTLASGGHQPGIPAVHLAASQVGGPAGADQTAVSYVNSHYPGGGAAQVLKSEPDVERGVPVYDVRVVAPNGTTYVVHVQRSNDAVLSVNAAERQVTSATTTTTTTAPPATSAPATTPPSAPATTPQAASPPVTTQPQLTEPVETPETPAAVAPGGSSPDRSSSSAGGSSPDHPSGSSPDHSTSNGTDN